MKTRTLIALLIALALSTPAHAFFLCANKTTQAVRYPTAQRHCSAAEIPLSTSPSVVDSTGRVVGPFSGDGVLFDIGGIFVDVVARHQGFLTDSGLWFASSNCSGPALVATAGNGALETTSVNDGETLYYGNPLEAEVVTPGSTLPFVGPFAGVCQAETGEQLEAAPALSISISALGTFTFQPPFHLQ